MSAGTEADPTDAEKAAYLAEMQKQIALFPASDNAVDLLSQTLILARSCRAIVRFDRGRLDEREKAELRRLAVNMQDSMAAAIVAVGTLAGKVGKL